MVFLNFDMTVREQGIPGKLRGGIYKTKANRKVIGLWLQVPFKEGSVGMVTKKLSC